MIKKIKQNYEEIPQMDKSIGSLINVLMASKRKILLETCRIIKEDIPYITEPKREVQWDDNAL